MRIRSSIPSRARFAFFDTSSPPTARGQPAYVVVPYPLETLLPNNGLPVFTVPFENDDESQRKLGKDSRVTFVAPADGDYLVRMTDVRGFAGDNYRYQLVIRRPQPSFQVSLSGANPTVGAGSGKAILVKAERSDNFWGPIRVDIEGLPPGYHVSTPLVIPAGLHEAARRRLFGRRRSAHGRSRQGGRQGDRDRRHRRKIRDARRQ